MASWVLPQAVSNAAVSFYDKSLLSIIDEALFGHSG